MEIQKRYSKQLEFVNMAATNPKALKAIMAAQQQGNGVIKISNHLFINSILSKTNYTSS